MPIEISTLELVLTSIGVANTLFLVLFFLFTKNGIPQANRLFALLLFFAMFRICDSWFMYYCSHTYGPDAMKVVYEYYRVTIFFYMLVGPTVLFYTKALIRPLSPIRYHYFHLVHFIPGAIVYIVMGTELVDTLFANTILGIHWFSIIVQTQVLLYLIVAAKRLKEEYRLSKSKDQSNVKWGIFIIIAALIIWIFAFKKHHFTMASFYAIALYGIVFIRMERYSIYKKRERDPVKGMADITQQMKEVMTTEKLYLNPKFCIQQLADQINRPAYVVSQILNDHLSTNFSHFVNIYRVNASKKMLTDPQYQKYTIAAIANEVGFNSVTVFNRAFKKATGHTPSTYKKLETSQHTK